MERQVFLDHIRRTRFAPGDRDAALGDARRIARFLRRRGARRVVGIGSAFVPERRFTMRSDIDIAVEGLDPGSFFSVLAKASNMTGFALDLVLIESATDAMLRYIREEGVEL